MWIPFLLSSYHEKPFPLDLGSQGTVGSPCPALSRFLVMAAGGLGWEQRGWDSGLGQGCSTPFSTGWSFSSECYDIKQTFCNPLVLAALFCILGGGTSQPLGNRSIMGISQAGCPPRAGGLLPLDASGWRGLERAPTAKATWYSVPAPTHPSAGCDKCAQRGGLWW